MALTLSDKKQVRSLPGALVRSFVAAAAVDLGEAVYINSSGEVAPTDANAAGTSQGRGIVVGASSRTPGDVFPAGSTVTVHLFGLIAGWSGMDENGAIYVSETAGGVTQTAPSGGGTWTNDMGYAVSADVWFVNPRNGVPTSNS